jgi:hypothetical protein
MFRSYEPWFGKAVQNLGDDTEQCTVNSLLLMVALVSDLQSSLLRWSSGQTLFLRAIVRTDPFERCLLRKLRVPLLGRFQGK